MGLTTVEKINWSSRLKLRSSGGDSVRRRKSRIKKFVSMAEVVTQDENPTRRKTLQERLTTLIESNMRNANLNHVF